MRVGLLLLISLWATSSVQAATFSCAVYNPQFLMKHFDDFLEKESEKPLSPALRVSVHKLISSDPTGNGSVCNKGIMTGVIGTGDPERLEAWLAQNPFASSIILRSPGGAIFPAMKMGRSIRSHFVATVSEPQDDEQGEGVEPATPRKNCNSKGCCLSACVLILAAGVYRDAGNIGLHRPSAADFATADYSSVKDALDHGLGAIRKYLDEMEISPTLYGAMMAQPSENVLLLGHEKAEQLLSGMSDDRDSDARGIAPSVYEWATAHCHREGRGGLCVYDLISKERLRRSLEQIAKGAH